MSKTLQQILVENPQSAKETWDILIDIFHDNKRTCSIALNVELHSLKLGDLTIDAYFCKIESITTVLTSITSPMNSDDVVTFALGGLPAKYDNEELRLRSHEQDTLIDASSSSPMVLLSNSGSNVRRSLSSMEKPAQINLTGQQGSSGPTSHETILPRAFTAGTLQDPALVPPLTDANIVRCMWLFRHTFLAEGTHSRYIARLVVNGSTQIEGIDVDETFSTVVKLGIIRTRKYATEILERAHMIGCNPSLTLVDNESKIGDDVYLHMHGPSEPYFLALKQILRAVYLSFILVQHQRIKHIEINIHFVLDLIVAGHVRVLHVPSRYQYADVFTKGLPTALFEEFRFSLSV
nr:ribonuclease H-like domain-containing protein [Tanacetum cinerariifolium]